MAAVATKSFWSAPDPDDPLSAALQPPPNESPEDRAARIRQQEEAVRISREIDDEIAIAKRAFDRRKKAIKILLLGEFAHLLSVLLSQPFVQARQSLARAQPSRVRVLSIRPSLRF